MRNSGESRESVGVCPERGPAVAVRDELVALEGVVGVEERRERFAALAHRGREHTERAVIRSQSRAPRVIRMGDGQRLIEPHALAIREVWEHSLEVLLILVSQRFRLEQQDD